MPRPQEQSADSGYPWVTFLSDYGHDDVFVGVCKGVIAQFAPQVRIIDVCHLITPQDVDAGAHALSTAIHFLPRGIHLALVDPQHETHTRGVVIETKDGSLLIGPDNGLLSLTWDSAGGIKRAVTIENRELWLDHLHATFRGRDVYAPVAGRLAAGTSSFEDVGPAVDPKELARIELRTASVDDDHVHAEIRAVDHFGNVSLNVARSDLEAAGIALGDAVELRCNGRTLAVPFTHSFGEVPVGRLTLCEDSFHAIQLAVNAGRANQVLRVTRGDAIVIARVPHQQASQRPAVTR